MHMTFLCGGGKESFYILREMCGDCDTGLNFVKKM